MGSLMHAWLVVALAAWVCGAASDSNSLVVQVGAPVSLHRGDTATLPCWLSPPQSAEGLEVRWYRGSDFDSPVMLYWAKKFEHASQKASYVGRVSFGTKDAASVGLTAGDVSLKLSNVTFEDTGDYTCYVSGDHSYDSAPVRLFVMETGTPLLLSAVWREDNMVNVSCESQGWYPEPTLLWSDPKQVLTPDSLNSIKDSSGLMSVHSWLLVPSSSEVSCSIGLSGKGAKEARVRLDNPPQPEAQKSGSSAAGWVAFVLLLVATLAGLGVLYYIKRVKKPTSRGDDVEGKPAEETQNLLSKENIQPTDLSALRRHYVNVILDKVENPYLTIKDDIFRDACDVTFPAGEMVTCHTAIKGTPGFSSGQHYWEVSLGNTNVALKKSWWVGVTSETIICQDVVSPTTADGFWFLSSSSDKENIFQFSTEPNVSMPVHSRPQTLGVYLDYDGGELSFYDVERENLIGRLSATFSREVFPFFNPGRKDKGPMKILRSRTEQGQSGDTGNSTIHSLPQNTVG